MVHAFAIELLWIFTCPDERHGFPSFDRRYYPSQSPPAYDVSKKVIWYASIALGPYSSSYLCAP